MDNTNKVPDFTAIAKDLTANAQRYAGSESVKFFKESFNNETKDMIIKLTDGLTAQ